MGDLNVGSQTCDCDMRGMHVVGVWSFSHFSPKALSGFSISGELEDSVLAVDQKASRERRGSGEVRVKFTTRKIS